jgi:hypothetical protein
MWWKYFVLMYENGKMRPVETSRNGVGGEEGKRIQHSLKRVDLTMIYCKNFYKCRNVPPVEQHNIKIKIAKQAKKKIS